MLEPEFDPTVNCKVCGCPMRWVSGYYVHDWAKASKEVRDANPEPRV